jgi:hypothetical protein
MIIAGGLGLSGDTSSADDIMASYLLSRDNYLADI